MGEEREREQGERYHVLFAPGLALCVQRRDVGRCSLPEKPLQLGFASGFLGSQLGTWGPCFTLPILGSLPFLVTETERAVDGP